MLYFIVTRLFRNATTPLIVMLVNLAYAIITQARDIAHMTDNTFA